MTLNMIRPKNETEDFLISITKSVKLSLNKLIEKQKKLWNLSLIKSKKNISFQATT